MEQAVTKSELRVLMLEDTPTDAELIERELRKTGITFTSKCVETRDAFVRALEEFRPDIVLSDYKLPDFDGLAALEIVQRDHPEVPVVMVTGALADIEAVELIHAGAKDYVLKDRLARLGPAVQRALSAEQSVRERQAAEKALRESEARYKRITEGLTDYQYTVRVENGHAVETRQSPASVTVTGYAPEEFAADPYLWIRMVMPEDRELVNEHVRQILSGKNVPPIEHRIIRKDGKIRWVSDTTILCKDASGKLLTYDGVIKDITEHKLTEQERLASAKRLEQTLFQAIEAMAATVEARDPYTAGHQRRVAALARAIAQEMGLTDDEIRGLYLAATIHDLGKVSIPAEILSKPGKLSRMEFELVKEHAQNGYEILNTIDFPWPIAQIVLQHHERLDGSGYPQALMSGQIKFEAKIVAVADVVEAMSSHRPYRPALGLDAALEEIVLNKGKLFDPAVVDACIKIFRERGFNFSI